jgi:hypothetical protein
MLAMCAMLQSPRLTMQALSGQEAFPVLPDPQGQPCLHTLHLGKFQRGGRAVAVPNSKIILFFGGAVDPWTYGSQVLRRGSLPLKNAFCVRHCGHPGHNAHTWPVLLAAAHPHACFSKACSSAMHTTAESVGQQGTVCECVYECPPAPQILLPHRRCSGMQQGAVLKEAVLMMKQVEHTHTHTCNDTNWLISLKPVRYHSSQRCTKDQSKQCTCSAISSPSLALNSAKAPHISLI